MNNVKVIIKKNPKTYIFFFLGKNKCMNEICIFSLFGFYNFFYCPDNIYLKIDKELKEFEFGTHILLAIDNDYLR